MFNGIQGKCEHNPSVDLLSSIGTHLKVESMKKKKLTILCHFEIPKPCCQKENMPFHNSETLKILTKSKGKIIHSSVSN
jgi:hypothetical protein